jgi:hypothetical protein
MFVERTVLGFEGHGGVSILIAGRASHKTISDLLNYEIAI